MSYLDKLLDGVEVEWKKLGEVAGIIRGVRITKKDLLADGEFPVVSGGTGYMGYTNQYNREAATITISQYGTAGYVKWQKKKFWANDICYCMNPNTSIILNRYLYFHLVNKQQHLYNISNRTSIPYNIERNKILNLQIPIPCPDNPTKSLEIQQKIVGILDTFTELTAELTVELTAELTARQKQYHYYREQLLSFDEGEVEWKTLGEVISKTYSGSTPKAGHPQYYDNGTIPWLRTQEVKFSDIESTETKITDIAVKNTGVKWIPVNCVIIAISGATAGRSAINKIPLTTNQHCLCLEINPKVALYRYAFHWVSFNYESLKNLGRGARGDLNSGIIKNFKIPIPPLEEQARIVSILDKFDTLTNSISEGLPKEIELRKKQYEYYRDMLLTFPQ